MPYHVEERNGKFAVVGPSGVHGTHSSRAKAERQITAINIHEHEGKRRRKKPGRPKR